MTERLLCWLHNIGVPSIIMARLSRSIVMEMFLLLKCATIICPSVNTRGEKGESSPGFIEHMHA